MCGGCGGWGEEFELCKGGADGVGNGQFVRAQCAIASKALVNADTRTGAFGAPRLPACALDPIPACCGGSSRVRGCRRGRGGSKR